MESVNVSQFKDFVVSNKSYYVDARLRCTPLVSRLSTDQMHIDGKLKIISFGKTENDPTCEHVHGMYVELPAGGDKIFIPASDHPWVETSNEQIFPAFIEGELRLSWEKDLVAGSFYIMLNEFGEKNPILIKCISDDKIEYALCNSIYDGNNKVYRVNKILCELPINAAKYYKFIPVNDVK